MPALQSIEVRLCLTTLQQDKCRTICKLEKQTSYTAPCDLPAVPHNAFAGVLLIQNAQPVASKAFPFA